jgi:Ca-activated chloride channel family protein
VQYLKPGERSGHDIALEVEIDAGVSIEKILSKSHTVAVLRDSEDSSKARVKLAAEDSIPNRDFVLRYAVAGDRIKSALLTQADAAGRGGYFTLMIVPPADMKSLERSPMEVVFVVDRSGSMSGRPMEQARAAIERGLNRLQPGDSFQVIDFAETASTLGPRPVEATPAGIRQGLAYSAQLNSGGGTMMLTGMKAALDFPHDPRRLRVVSFLTDGYIGNEAEILRAMYERLGAARVFSFGVGSATNRYLLAEMARLGRGAVAYVGLDEEAGDIMDLFFDRISHPAMTDLRVDWGGARVSEVYPARTPDLFVGRPVLLAGRYEGPWGGTIRVKGLAAGVEREIEIAADAEGQAVAKGVLPAVWARMKIADLCDRELLEAGPRAAEEAQGAIKRVALEYGLMSAYTSFVAVDSMTRTAGEFGVSVVQPVEVPAGVRYETAVGGTAATGGRQKEDNRP